MKTFKTIAVVADSIVSLSLLVMGCYMFFFKGFYITGSIVIIAHSIYQACGVYCLSKLEKN